MLTRDSNAPPEAYMGIVSPAWDVWCLGAMLREILAPGTTATPLPAPFDAIVRDSLAPNPGERIPLEEISRLLDQSNIQPVALEPEPEIPLPRHPQRPVLTTPGLHEGRPFLLVAAAACVLALLVLIFNHRPVAVNPYASSHVTDAKPSPAPAPPAASTPEPEAKPASAVPKSDAEREIAALLNRWADAARNRNVAGQLSCYAPVLDRFFGRQRVTAEELRREKERVFSQIGSIRRLDIGNIRFDRVTDHWAVVSFDKDWAFGSPKPFEGRARDEFVLRPIDGQWKIASEREIKVYWTNKGSPKGGSPSSSPSTFL
jgi:ketosteroid isomerase-like protein